MKPRNNSLVKVIDEWGDIYLKFMGEQIIFLGEIPNMGEHCLIYTKGEILAGFHTDIFVELNEDEV